MNAVLLDTNAWAWTLLRSGRLSRAGRSAIDNARTRYLSPVSLYEVNQKVRLGQWPEFVPYAPQLLGLIGTQGLDLAALNAEICARAGALDWSHRNPFDRLLAATALHYGMPIISADSVFDGVVSRVW